MPFYLPCQICCSRKTSSAYEVIANPNKVTYYRIVFKGKRKRIEIGLVLNLCKVCASKCESKGIVLKLLRTQLNSEELAKRVQVWKDVEGKWRPALIGYEIVVKP